MFVSKTFASGSSKFDKHLLTSYQQGGFTLKIKGFRENPALKKTRKPLCFRLAKRKPMQNSCCEKRARKVLQEPQKGNGQKNSQIRRLIPLPESIWTKRAVPHTREGRASARPRASRRLPLPCVGCPCIVNDLFGSGIRPRNSENPAGRPTSVTASNRLEEEEPLRVRSLAPHRRTRSGNNRPSCSTRSGS